MNLPYREPSTEADQRAVNYILDRVSVGDTPRQAMRRKGLSWYGPQEPTWRHAQYALAKYCGPRRPNQEKEAA